MASATPREVARLAVFMALVAALGFLRQVLLPIPNVELMSLGAFVAGSALGSAGGALCGAGAMSIYSLLNPLGPAPPPVFASQITGLALFGVAGGLLGTRVQRTRAAPLWAGAIGLALTFVYDVLTNLGTAWVMGALRDPWPVLISGLAFGVGHMVWNMAAFAVAAPPLVGVVVRHREGR
jgi:hypothetical protein